MSTCGPRASSPSRPAQTHDEPSSSKQLAKQTRTSPIPGHHTVAEQADRRTTATARRGGGWVEAEEVSPLVLPFWSSSDSPLTHWLAGWLAVCLAAWLRSGSPLWCRLCGAGSGWTARGSTRRPSRRATSRDGSVSQAPPTTYHYHSQSSSGSSTTVLRPN